MNACQKLFSKFITLDTETTGFSTEDEVLSCSVVDQDGNILIDTLVKPIYKTSWDAAQRIHGISPEMVFSKGISYNSLLSQLRQTVEDYEYVIIYNAKFDTKFFPRYFFENNRVLCAMESSLAFLSNHPTYEAPHRYLKQVVLAQLLGIETNDISLHSSKDDAELCRRIWHKMLAESHQLDISFEEILQLN